MDSSINKPRDLNDALTIHKLPIELLLFIFECVLRKEDTAPMYYRQICTLSGVCARWLFVIHRSPQLWTTVAGIIKQQGFRKILERSSGKLIDVEYEPQLGFGWRYGEPHFVDFLGSVSSATGRWRSLVLGTSYYPGDRPNDFLQFTAPNLERLVFKNDQAWDMEDVELFGGHCPNLKHIHLERADCKWSQAAFKGLESLKLFQVSFDSVGTILDITRDSPQLQTLEIRNCDVSERVPENTQQVSLPNLKFLRAEFDSDDGLTWATQQFLDHISASSQCSLYISLADTDDESDDEEGSSEDPLPATFCEWLFGKQTKEVHEGMESFELGFDVDKDDSNVLVTFELSSGPASIKGGIRGFRLEDLHYVLKYIQNLFQRSRALKTFTTLKLSGQGAEVLNNTQFTDPLKEIPPITHLELVDPVWPLRNPSPNAIPESVAVGTTSAFRMLKTFILRDVAPEDILDMVLRIFWDSQAHTPSMSQCRVDHLDHIELHVAQQEFDEVETVVDVLRNDSRIGKVDLYIAL
ncbi:hypothetical protein FS837_009072 [Tulasnella sp. UAMH 9824]|nr:hypothetical protein FS837_009072 [Tulasnella sp. UAMH 9824]